MAEMLSKTIEQVIQEKKEQAADPQPNQGFVNPMDGDVNKVVAQEGDDHIGAELCARLPNLIIKDIPYKGLKLLDPYSLGMFFCWVYPLERMLNTHFVIPWDPRDWALGAMCWGWLTARIFCELVQHPLTQFLAPVYVINYHYDLGWGSQRRGLTHHCHDRMKNQLNYIKSFVMTKEISAESLGRKLMGLVKDVALILEGHIRRMNEIFHETTRALLYSSRFFVNGEPKHNMALPYQQRFPSWKLVMSNIQYSAERWEALIKPKTLAEMTHDEIELAIG